VMAFYSDKGPVYLMNDELSLRHDMLPERYIQLEKAFLSECVSCGVCVDVCPCIPFSSIRDMGSKEISKEIKAALADGNLSDAVVERAFACSRCGICIDICPKGIDVYELQQALRCQILNQGRRKLTLNQIHTGARVYDDYDVDNVLSSIQIRPDEKRWVDDLSPDIPRKGTVLFLGCSTRRYVDKINTTIDILESLGLDFITLAGGVFCCGARSQAVGKLREADREGERLIAALAGYGAEEVLVFCPACLHMLKEELPNVTPLPFTVKHVFEIILENLGKLHFRHAVNKTVTFHDPCKLGRMCHDYESARAVLRAIPGVNVVEMSDSREKSNCCGGTAWRYNPDYARRLGKKAMDCAAETGADIMATACMLCYMRFYDMAAEYPFDIRDVLSIIGESLGIEYENKLIKYRGYHDPERVIAEAREYIQASEYSAEEMSCLLRHLLP
jgi:heterodisulfide reductase subunit D